MRPRWNNSCRWYMASCRLAGAYLRRERPNHTFAEHCPVHRAFMRLVHQQDAVAHRTSTRSPRNDPPHLRYARSQHAE